MMKLTPRNGSFSAESTGYGFLTFAWAYEATASQFLGSMSLYSFGLVLSRKVLYRICDGTRRTHRSFRCN